MTDIHSQAAILTLHRKLYAALKAHEGAAWKEVYSEAHLHYYEIPLWVLLFEDSDPVASHAILKRTLVPMLEAIGEIKLSLTYYCVKGSERMHLDRLETTSHILNAGDDEDSFGIWQKESSRNFWLFNATHSGREA